MHPEHGLGLLWGEQRGKQLAFNHHAYGCSGIAVGTVIGKLQDFVENRVLLAKNFSVEKMRTRWRQFQRQMEISALEGCWDYINHGMAPEIRRRHLRSLI